MAVTPLIGTSPPVVAPEVEGVEDAGQRRQGHHGDQVAGVVLGLDVGPLSAAFQFHRILTKETKNL